VRGDHSGQRPFLGLSNVKKKSEAPRKKKKKSLQENTVDLGKMMYDENRKMRSSSIKGRQRQMRDRVSLP